MEEARDREIQIQKANKEVIDTFNEHAKQFEIEKASNAACAALTIDCFGRGLKAMWPAQRAGETSVRSGHCTLGSYKSVECAFSRFVRRSLGYSARRKH